MMLYWIVKVCDLAEEFASEMILGMFRDPKQAEKFMEDMKSKDTYRERPMYWITTEMR